LADRTVLPVNTDCANQITLMTNYRWHLTQNNSHYNQNNSHPIVGFCAYCSILKKIFFECIVHKKNNFHIGQFVSNDSIFSCTASL